MSTDSLNDFARKVADYFGEAPIPPYLDGDLELRDKARELIGLPAIPAWKEGDRHEAYEGHKIHCPKCGFECIAEEVDG